MSDMVVVKIIICALNILFQALFLAVLKVELFAKIIQNTVCPARAKYRSERYVLKTFTIWIKTFYERRLITNIKIYGNKFIKSYIAIMDNN